MAVFAMLEKFLAVVCGDNYESILQNSQIPKPLEQTTNVVVGIENLPIVLVEDPPDPLPILPVGEKLQRVDPSSPDGRIAAVIEGLIVR
jgi:hypothetical protein